MSRNRLKYAEGMTLIEVVIAIAILALFTLGAAKLITSVRGNISIAREHNQAINLARNRIERARAVPFSSLWLLAETNGPRLNSYGLNDVDGAFKRNTAISTVTNGLAEVTVEVWVLNRQTHNFDQKPQKLQTYVAQMFVKTAP